MYSLQKQKMNLLARSVIVLGRRMIFCSVVNVRRIIIILVLKIVFYRSSLTDSTSGTVAIASSVWYAKEKIAL